MLSDVIEKGKNEEDAVFQASFSCCFMTPQALIPAASAD